MLAMDFDNSHRANIYFQISTGTLVKYTIIAPGALDANSLDEMPLDFVNILPLPYDDCNWSVVHISRDPSTGELQSSLSEPQLRGVSHTWHSR